MGGHWKAIHRAKFRSRSPPLVIKHEVENSSYTIHISDLVNIWTEHLTAKDIRRRALNSDTSIDPSEDQGQMRQFLQCVDDALEQKRGTSLELEFSSTAQCLVLKTLTPLPGGLGPLEWFVELYLDSAFVLTEELMFPLLYQQHFQQAESASLFQQLKEKDIIIDKLIDSSVSEGTPLSKIFPGAAPSRSELKSDPRQALTRHVRGITRFNEHEWRDNLRENVFQPTSIDSLLDNMSVPDLTGLPQALPPPDHGEWWLHMGNEDTTRSKSQSKPPLSMGEDLDTGGDSPFQRQPTPPRRISPKAPSNPAEPRSKATPKPHSDSSSTTDDEDDNQDRPNHHNHNLHPPTPDLHVDNTKPDSQDLTSRPKPTPTNAANPPIPTKPPSKLGKIGGKPRFIPAPNPTSPSSTSSTRKKEKPDHPTTQPPLLDTPAASSSRPRPAQPHPAPSSTKPSAEPELKAEPETLTETERADRKRAAVKRDLEAKAAQAAGKKKVRRF